MRTKKSFLNFASSYIFYLVIIVLSLIKTKIMLNSLGEDISALNQLYINLFAYISIAEAGIGSALMYRLYSLLVKKEYDKINSLYTGTTIIFRIIGIIILTTCLGFSFFMQYFIAKNNFSISFLIITFMLFAIKNSIDYFMFTPRFIMQADNRMYKINVGIYIFRIIEVAIELFLLYRGFNYIAILIPAIFIRVIQNLIVNRIVFKHYNWLKFEPKTKDLSVKSDVKALLVHRIAGLVFENTDIILVSIFIGAKAVMIYSACNYVLKYVKDSVVMVFNSIKDSMGNVINSENKEKIISVFKNILMLFSFLSVTMSIIFFFTLRKFAFVWLGEEYVASSFTLLFFIIILYIFIMLKSYTIFIPTMGLYKKTQKMYVMEAAVNIVSSLIFVNFWGINGVLIGTIIAKLSVTSWYLTRMVNKILFQNKSLIFFTTNLKNLIYICFSAPILYFLTNWISKYIVTTSYLGFIFYFVIVIISSLIVVALIFFIFEKGFRLFLKEKKKIILRRLKK